jgi:hypothetical protein
MTRPFWFGLAMFTAFGSIYAGLFGLAWLQYPLIALAVLAVVMAFRAPLPPPQDDPRKKP